MGERAVSAQLGGTTVMSIHTWLAEAEKARFWKRLKV